MTRKAEPRIVDAEPEDITAGPAEGRAATGPQIVAAEPEGLSAAPAEESAAKAGAADLDEDERALRALRLDLPGGNVAPPNGIIALSVSNRFPRREFFRTHPDYHPTMHVIDHAAGLDVEYHIVSPSMVPELASIGVDVLPHRIYIIMTTEGTIKLMPVRQADIDGSQNEWNRTREVVLLRGMTNWVRTISDRANGRYRVFRAPEGRFPDPLWPDLTLAKIIRLAFTDRGHLIDGPEHPLFRKWAARDDTPE
jgi:hypothetical protein